MAYDASNRRDVKALERQARLADQQRKEVVNGIMSVAPGRRWICDLLETCHIFATSLIPRRTAGGVQSRLPPLHSRAARRGPALPSARPSDFDHHQARPGYAASGPCHARGTAAETLCVAGHNALLVVQGKRAVGRLPDALVDIDANTGARRLARSGRKRIGLARADAGRVRQTRTCGVRAGVRRHVRR